MYPIEISLKLEYDHINFNFTIFLQEYDARYNGFLSGPQLTLFFNLPLTIGHLDFVVEFYWKYCVSSKNFAHS